MLKRLPRSKVVGQATVETRDGALCGREHSLIRGLAHALPPNRLDRRPEVRAIRERLAQGAPFTRLGPFDCAWLGLCSHLPSINFKQTAFRGDECRE